MVVHARFRRRGNSHGPFHPKDPRPGNKRRLGCHSEITLPSKPFSCTVRLRLRLKYSPVRPEVAATSQPHEAGQVIPSSRFDRFPTHRRFCCWGRVEDKLACRRIRRKLECSCQLPAGIAVKKDTRIRGWRHGSRKCFYSVHNPPDLDELSSCPLSSWNISKPRCPWFSTTLP